MRRIDVMRIERRKGGLAKARQATAAAAENIRKQRVKFKLKRRLHWYRLDLPAGDNKTKLPVPLRQFSLTSLCAGEQGQQHLEHLGQPAFKDGAVRQQLGDPGGGAHPQLPGGEKEVHSFYVEDNDDDGVVVLMSPHLIKNIFKTIGSCSHRKGRQNPINIGPKLKYVGQVVLFSIKPILNQV